MSRAAVEAKKRDRARRRKTAANEHFFAMAEYSSMIDSAVVRCDGCGFGPYVTHAGLVCPMCGHDVATSDPGDDS